MSQSLLPVARWLWYARTGMGSLFLWSGIAKSLHPIAFSDNLRNFELLGDPWIAFVSLFLPAFEMVTGLCLLAGIWWRGATVWVIIAGALFSAALISAWARGLEIACGCFGPEIGTTAPNLPFHLAGLALLIGLGMAMLLRSRKPDASGD